MEQLANNIEVKDLPVSHNGDIGNSSQQIYKTELDKRVEKASKLDTIPLLPIDGFPIVVQRLIENCTEVYGIHRDFFSGAFLSASSISIGSVAELSAMEYTNNVLLWIALIAPSGMGKSTPNSIFFAPIRNEDKKAYKRYLDELSQWEYEQAQGGNKDKGVDKPYFISIMTDGKATPESLIEMLSNDSRGSLLFRDELIGIVKDAEKERSGFLEGTLSFWSGEGTSIRTISRGVQSIPKAFLAIYGGIQPHLLPFLGKDGRDHNGFIARFCCIYPDNVFKPYHSDKKIDENLIHSYHNLLNNLLENSNSIEESRKFYLSPESKYLYQRFYNKNCDIINEKGTTPFIRQATAKLDIIVLRIALLLHVVKLVTSESNGTTIQANIMQDAINICEYFRATASKVGNEMSGQSSQVINNKEMVAKFLSQLGNTQTEIANVLKVTQAYVCGLLKK